MLDVLHVGIALEVSAKKGFFSLKESPDVGFDY